MILKTIKLYFSFLLICFNAEFLSAEEQCERGLISDCVVFGNIHVKTFDGNVYDFNSSCTYNLVSIKAKNLDVNLLRNPTRLQVKYASRDFQLIITDTSITFTRDGIPYSIPQTLNGLSVSKPGRMVILEIKSIGMKIKFDGTTVEIVQNNDDFDHIMVGLCSNNDGCADNDLITSDGSLTESEIIFANSWTLEPCSTGSFENACGDNDRLNAQALNYCKNITSLAQFSNCQEYSKDFLNICISEYCSCKLVNRWECMCEMLDVFVKTCNVNTNSITEWREPKLCPIICSNPDQHFLSCAPDGKQLSCGEEFVETPSINDCEEGCYCPSGMRLFQGKCLFEDECPCFYEDNWYEQGSSVALECNTCICKKGKWACTDYICVTDGGCWGDPHYTTFDGKKYDFMGKCTYYVVRGIGFDIMCDHFVYKSKAFVKDFESSLPSYCARVIVKVQNDVIELEQKHVVKVNNEQISWLPHRVSGIEITNPSSQFTQVNLRNYVSVSWNGDSRITVSIPTSMKGRINGLFGTYNADPTDDFTLPNGTIVTDSNLFGHSWVVPGSCASENVNTDPVPHPCDANPDKKPWAEANCAILKTSLFEGCSDDVDSAYEECIYDGCLCTEISCLCDFYAQQGEMCAAKGILIDWRQEISECAIQCPAGQQYQICGDSCTRSCNDISANPTCSTRCVDGCNCPPGQTLDNNDQCIPIGECPCVLDNIRYPAEFIFIDTNDKSKHVCENALWTITPATDEELGEFPNIEDLENQCNRNDFFVFSGCKRTNEETCLNKHLNERPNFDDCQSGCECMEGFVMDTELNMCVRPEDCPCMYQGISYPDDAIINNRDERCVCVYGFWECSPQTDHWEKCSIWGNVHVRTFDETLYTFNGFCEYILFEHVFDETGVIRVTVETGKCPAGSCIQRLEILYRSNSGQTENLIFLNENEVFSPTSLTTLNVTDLGQSTIIDVLNFDVRVVWNRDGWVHLHVSQDWIAKDHAGLCGKYDNDATNDLDILQIKATQVSSFVDYNRGDRTCAKSTELNTVNAMFPEDPCNILYTNIFRECRFLKPVDDYFNRCIIDAKTQLNLPELERTNYYCQTIGAYAQECNDVGAVVNWRSDSICPNSCPLDKDYYPCKSVCTENDCDQDGMCFEGCGKIRCVDE
nr:von Willebrand factor-like [Onthophagus taurus]